MINIISAGFKIIKSFLPPRTVAAMRFVSAKNIHEYIPSQYVMRRWGGKVDYEYIHEQDVKQAVNLDDAILEFSGSTETINNNNNTILQTPKKVRFFNEVILNRRKWLESNWKLSNLKNYIEWFF